MANIIKMPKLVFCSVPLAVQLLSSLPVAAVLHCLMMPSTAYKTFCDEFKCSEEKAHKKICKQTMRLQILWF